MQRTAAVAHGMGVFAQDEGLVRIGLDQGRHILGVGVHAAGEIRGIRIALVIGHAFIMDGTGGIEPAHLPGHFPDHLASEALITAGPENDRGVVLIPLLHAVGAIQHRRQPHGIVAGNRACLVVAAGLPCGVGFHVGFVDHIDAVAVAQLVPQAVVGIMAGADGIDIVALVLLDILQHVLLGDAAASLSTELVPVGATDAQAAAIEHQHTFHDLDLAQAHLRLGYFDDLVVTGQNEPQGIQIRVLCAPQLGFFYRQGDGERLCASLHGLRFGHGHTRRIQQLGGELGFGALILGHLHLSIYHRLGEMLAELGADIHILHMSPGQCGEGHIPDDAAETPEVLILQPCTGSKTDHLHHQQVFALTQGIGDIEPGGGEAILAIADELAVHPAVQHGLHTMEGEHHPLASPVLRQNKGAGIAAGGVLGGKLRRGKPLVAIPRILYIHILRRAVALQLNMPGHLDLTPAGTVKIRQPEVIGAIGRVFGVEKLPVAIQAHMQAGLVCAGFFQRAVAVVIGHRRQTVDSKGFRIVDVGWVVGSHRGILLVS